MTGNGSSTEESELSPKQQKLIAALVTGNSITVAAAAAGIGEATAYRWLKLAHFQDAYKAAKQAVYDESLEGLRDNVTQAIDTLKNIMISAEIDPAVRVRAANIYLTHSLKVHKVDENEITIKEIEAAVKRGYQLHEQS